MVADFFSWLELLADALAHAQVPAMLPGSAMQGRWLILIY